MNAWFLAVVSLCVLSLLLVADSQKLVEQQQISHDTARHRHPQLFALAAESLHGNTSVHKVLSFGCSRGLEAWTLAKRYFLRSAILGVDLDDAVLAEARHFCAAMSDRVFFFNGARIPATMFGPYRAIFANNVLCVNPAPADDITLMEVYPFRKFEQALLELDGMLEVGGLLACTNTNYRLLDTKLAQNYEIVSSAEHSHSIMCGRVVVLRDVNGARLDHTHEPCLYRKMSLLDA